MTDSSAWLIYEQLAASDRLRLLQDLFGASGIRLNFLRVPMAASDFTFSPDRTATTTCRPVRAIPACRSSQSLTISRTSFPRCGRHWRSIRDFEILANEWSPPGWMKANGSLDNINDQGTLLPSAYGPWRLLRQIHPGVWEQRRADQCDHPPERAEDQWFGHLIPRANPARARRGELHLPLSATRASAGRAAPEDLRKRSELDQLTYADSLSSGPAAGDLDGIAWHCYFGSPTVMSQLQQSAPGLDQIADECSPEIRNFGAPEYLISTLRNWASVVATWNLALDPQGGPHGTAYGCPGCTGVVTIDEQSHTVSFSSEYYQLGQVGAFVQPGAVRIDSPNFVTYGLNSSNIETVSSGLDDVAFLNPDGSRVLIAYNHSTAPISFGVQSDGNYFAYTIPAQAMTTFTWQ